MQLKHFLHVRMLIICVCSLFVMILVSACSGVGTITTANGATVNQVTGSIQSINPSAHSVTLNVNGQQITVSGLTDQQIAALQSQVGKTYTIQATQNGANAYTIATGSTPQDDDTTMQQTTVTANNTGSTGASEPGSISFTGKVQSVSASSIVVSMPNGESLTMSITAQTDRSDDDSNTQITQGQQVKVEATANPDGSFTATKLDTPDSGDLQDPNEVNTVDFQGVTTSSVSNNTISFKVGSKSYSFPIASTAQVEGVSSTQAIGANQQVKVDALFNGSNGTAIKVEVDNGND
jgi:hypothetical protein